MAGDDADLGPGSASRRARRSWPQRLTIVAVVVAAFACFAAAGAIYGAQRVLEDRNLAPAIVDPRTGGDAGFESDGAIAPADSNPSTDDVADLEESGSEEIPPSTFPPAEPEAKNFLVTGADNNSCVDPDSPYAAAFGDRSGLGERSDTIMMWRINPETSQAAVLSFPRDLWVTIAGRSGNRRINEAYQRDNAQLLIDTIYANFGIVPDHWIQIDFCAFKTLVDAVDGVGVPFETPVRDVNTGLYVPEPGCFEFDGDHALAYVRSRKMQSFIDGEWVTDGTSDLGRISRQQDFIRRVAESLRSGVLSPDVIGGLIKTNSDYITTDANLTVDRILEFAGVMSGIAGAEIGTYQIEARGEVQQGQAVLIPRIEGENMQEILAVFRGEATIANAPDQHFQADPATTSEAPTTSAPAVEPQASTDSTQPADGAVASSTVPEVVVEENVYGVVPDAAQRC